MESPLLRTLQAGPRDGEPWPWPGSRQDAQFAPFRIGGGRSARPLQQPEHFSNVIQTVHSRSPCRRTTCLLRLVRQRLRERASTNLRPNQPNGEKGFCRVADIGQHMACCTRDVQTLIRDSSNDRSVARVAKAGHVPDEIASCYAHLDSITSRPTPNVSDHDRNPPACMVLTVHASSLLLSSRSCAAALGSCT